MKAFETLTHDELIALDDTQIDYYINRACAEAGVPLLPPSPPVQPEVAHIDKPVTHYIVAGIRFSDEKDARQVEAAITRCQSRRTLQYLGGGYHWQNPQHDAPADDPIVVSMERVFDAAACALQKADDDAKKAKKEAFESAKKSYDAALTGRENCARDIRSTISAAWKLENRRRELTREYDRYLPLANSDATVAKRFLQKAYSDARDVLPNLFPAGWNDEPAKEAEAETVKR